MRKLQLILFVILCCNNPYSGYSQESTTPAFFCDHKVILDSENKLLPWFIPQEKAYDHFLHLRWDFIKTKVPNSPGPLPRSKYPQYYFYCAFIDKN